MADDKRFPLPFRIALRMGGALRVLGLRRGEPLLPRLLFMGTDAGESMDALRRIRSVDDWATTWTSLGQRHSAAGHEAAAAGDSVTAAESLKRATAYLRVAEYLMPDPAERRRLWEQLVAVCSLAGEQSAPRISRRILRAGGLDMPALLCVPDPGTPAPCVLTFGGVDGVKEEFLDLLAAYAARGWAGVALDLPGQGELRRFHGVPWRPDVEHLLTEVVDQLANTPGVDGDRIGVVGGSVGGYFALRAAATDQRLVGCAIISAPVRLREVYRGAPPPIPETMRYNLAVRTDRDALAALGEFDAVPLLSAISCPLLQVHGGRDGTVPVAQAKLVQDTVHTSLRSVIFPDGDHMCFNHRPEWEGILRRWLNERFTDNSPGQRTR